MKNHILSALALSLITNYFALNTCKAQAPQGIPYQAIARNASGVAIASTAVKVRFSIRDSIANGAIKFQETHNPTTSALGLFSVNVGMGTVVSGSFSGINWGKNAKFLQVELDPAGGSTYTDLGTTQMMSVPYALFAGNVNGLPSGGTEGQSLSICGGQPTWTTNGVCPGRIGSLNCSGMQSNGQLFSGFNANFTITIPYSGGNGGPFSSATFSSTEVTGVTATLGSGNFNNGAGVLTLSIIGIPSGIGNALFQISIGGQSCNISLSSLTTTNPVDIDGNMYQTVIIGNQLWFKENLKVSKYRNGDTITTNLDPSIWQTTSTGAYELYKDNPVYNTIYGKLYNWYAASDSRGLCPTGWHVPSETDWTILENFLGGQNIAGGKMKSVTGWASPNFGASNSSGFTALPGGSREGYYGGYGGSVGYYATWWSKTENTGDSAWGRYLDFSNGTTTGPAPSQYSVIMKNVGVNVRCIKD